MSNVLYQAIPAWDVSLKKKEELYITHYSKAASHEVHIRNIFDVMKN